MASRRKKSGEDGADGEASKGRGRGARGLWNGAISFSLIHIPVSLHTASRSSTVDLDLLDKRDFAPVGYQRYNKSTGKTVEWDDVVKGYEYEKDQYVVLTDEDFRRVEIKSNQTVDIREFVQLEEIDARFFDQPYFLYSKNNSKK